MKVVRNCKAVGTVSRETSRSICRIFWWSKRSSIMSGLSGRKWVREPNVRVSKMFNPNRREIRVPEYRQGIKDPNTTQWRRGPIRHTTMLVNVFVVTRLDFGQGVRKGATYRQSALIPTCDAPIQSYTNHTCKCVRSRSGTHGKISQHNSRHKSK